jgi:hypothetical protein
MLSHDLNLASAEVFCGNHLIESSIEKLAHYWGSADVDLVELAFLLLDINLSSDKVLVPSRVRHGVGILALDPEAELKVIDAFLLVDVSQALKELNAYGFRTSVEGGEEGQLELGVRGGVKQGYLSRT